MTLGLKSTFNFSQRNEHTPVFVEESDYVVKMRYCDCRFAVGNFGSWKINWYNIMLGMTVV